MGRVESRGCEVLVAVPDLVGGLTPDAPSTGSILLEPGAVGHDDIAARGGSDAAADVHRVAMVSGIRDAVDGGDLSIEGFMLADAVPPVGRQSSCSVRQGRGRCRCRACERRGCPRRATRGKADEQCNATQDSIRPTPTITQCPAAHPHTLPDPAPFGERIAADMYVSAISATRLCPRSTRHGRLRSPRPIRIVPRSPGGSRRGWFARSRCRAVQPCNL